MDINKLEYSQDEKNIVLDIAVTDDADYSKTNIDGIAIQDIDNYTLSYPIEKAFIITKLSPEKYKITNTKRYTQSIPISEIASSGVINNRLYLVHISYSVDDVQKVIKKLCYSKIGINKQITIESNVLKNELYDINKLADLSFKSIVFDSFNYNGDIIQAISFWKKYIAQYNNL